MLEPLDIVPLFTIMFPLEPLSPIPKIASPVAEIVPVLVTVTSFTLLISKPFPPVAVIVPEFVIVPVSYTHLRAHET